MRARTKPLSNSNNTCCQQALEVSLASVPSADTFAVLAQAVLKHLLYMRQQMPAPFHDLAEVRTCAASLTGFVVFDSIRIHEVHVHCVPGSCLHTTAGARLPTLHP